MQSCLHGPGSYAKDVLAVGSSRIPPAFNGLAALKTSEGRLSTSGIATIVSGSGRKNPVLRV